jgi:DNA polymerase-3 subunit gamma/tau
MDSLVTPSSPGKQAQNYRVLALETRPQTLGALVGQANVRKVLSDMIASNRLPHALLLTGTRGTGKTSTARIFAKALCCEKGPTPEPCGICQHCEAITASVHEDVLEIDGASNTGVDQIRELRESARFYPKIARYKIFIIDEVHMLSIGAFNALLKTLEEPPPQVLFVLATTEVGKVPATVRSRCMVLPFRKVDLATLAGHLGQVLKLRNINAEQEALVLIAREGRGSFRDALSLVEQAIPYAEGGLLTRASVEGAFGMRDRECAKAIFLAMVRRDVSAGLAAIDQADRQGFDFGRVMQQVGEYARFSLLLRVEAESSGPKSQHVQKPQDAPQQEAASPLAALFEELLESERIELLEATAALSRLALSECFRLTQQASQEMARSPYPRPWAEIALLDAIDRSHWMDSRDLLAALSGSGTTGGQGPAAISKPLPLRLSDPLPQKPKTTLETKPPAGIEQATESSNQHHDKRGSNERLDLSKLRQWIGLVSTRSVPLGAKLRHAQFEVFCASLVKLNPSPDNALYGTITETDRAAMLGALSDIGFGEARIEGFSLPGSPSKGAKTPLKTEPRQAQRPPGTMQPGTTAPGSVSTTARPKGTEQKLATMDPFAPSDNTAAFKEWVSTKQQGGTATVSLSQIDAATASQDFEKKRERLLAHPFVVKLGAAASSLEITPHSESSDPDAGRH